MYKKHTDQIARESKQRSPHTVLLNLGDDVLVPTAGFLQRPGHPLGRTISVVCGKCNNTWMAKIESDMKSTYERLFESDHTSICQEEANAIAMWGYLKYCLHENTYPAQNYVPFTSDNAPYEIGAIGKEKMERWRRLASSYWIPDYVYIYIARSTPSAEGIYGRANYIPLGYAARKGDLSEIIGHFALFMLTIGPFHLLVAANPVPERGWEGELSRHRSGTLKTRTLVEVTQPLKNGIVHLLSDTGVSCFELHQIFVRLVPQEIQGKLLPYTI
ncbi:MAG TPA: hypothetical protein P5218_02255 [Planctomycetota bacterium]|nr:hypothetical protein [Planctomycetota bacterium]HPF13947.1 hypothetical protein [Planctomycetota bacterium]HRV80223.1 hypothetical protein [Planctomycetota bacterium]